MAIQTKYQKDLEDGKIKAKPVVVPAPPKKVVVPARTVLKNSTPKATPPKAAPKVNMVRPSLPTPKASVPSMGRAMTVPKYMQPISTGKTSGGILARPNLEDMPDDLFNQLVTFVRKDPNFLNSDVPIPQLGFKSPKDVRTAYNTTKMIGGYTLNPQQRAIADQFLGINQAATALATSTPAATASATPKASATLAATATATPVPGSPGAAAAGQRATYGNKVDDAKKRAAYYAKVIDASLDAQRKRMSQGNSPMDIIGREIFGPGNMARALSFPFTGAAGGFSPGLFTNPSGTTFGKDSLSYKRGYETPVAPPTVPEAGLDEYGRNIKNWQQMLIASGLTPVDPNVTTGPPFVPGATDTSGGGSGGGNPVVPQPDGSGGGGGGGGGGDSDDGFSMFDKLAKLMEIGQYAKQPVAEDRTRENDLYKMLQESQNQMQALQQQYIEALIKQLNAQPQTGIPAPVGPGAPAAAAGNMYSLMGIPKVAPTGSNLQFSNAGLGYLNSIDPSLLQALMQYLKSLNYTGQGQMGSFGEMNYARQGGLGSLLQSDASFENPLAYTGLTPQMREPAEAGLRSLFAQMGLMG